MSRQERVKSLPITHVEYEEVNNCYERALVHMHKMPKIWKVCAAMHSPAFELTVSSVAPCVGLHGFLGAAAANHADAPHL
jgi:hypothetical protein